MELAVLKRDEEIKLKDSKINALQAEMLECGKIINQIFVEANENLRKEQELVISKNLELQQIKAELSAKTNEFEKKLAEINVVQAELSQLKSKAAAESTRKTLQGVNQQPLRDDEPSLECPSEHPHPDRNVSSLGICMARKSGPNLHPRAVQTGNPRIEPVVSSSTSSKSPPPPGPQSRKSTSPGKQILSASKPTPYCTPGSHLPFPSFADQLPKKERGPSKFQRHECEHCPLSFRTREECERHYETSHDMV